MPPNKQSTARGIIRECRPAEGCEGMGRPRRGGAFPPVAGVRVGYEVRRLASPNALHDVFGVFDAVRRLFPESDLVSFYGLLVLLRYLDLGHTPPSSVCARTCRWGLVGDSAVHVAMRRVQLAAQLIAVLFELAQQRYERREGLPLDWCRQAPCPAPRSAPRRGCSRSRGCMPGSRPSSLRRGRRFSFGWS